MRTLNEDLSMFIGTGMRAVSMFIGTGMRAVSMFIGTGMRAEYLYSLSFINESCIINCEESLSIVC